MISIIDVQNGNLEVAYGHLPLTFVLPEQVNAVFFYIGGELTIDDVIRYRAVNRVVIDNSPGQYYSPIGINVVYDAENDQVVATVQYPESPNVPVPTSDDVFNGYFPDNDRAAQMIFAGFLELARRVGALDGQSPANLTVAQLKTWFKNKVPVA